jgi:hypothetical protein
MRYHPEVLVSADKDGKANPPVAKPATKTVVGVPSLPVPPDRPSDMEMTRELPPKRRNPDATDEQETALTAAVTVAEADRVLARTGFTQEEIPTAQGGGGAPTPSPRTPSVAGAVPKAPPRAPTQTPAPSRDTYKGVPRAASPRPSMDAEKTTRPGVAPQTGISPKGRSTLLLDSSAPPASPGDASQEGPPIVVPGTTAMPPNSVTQPPPWSEGAARPSGSAA